MKHLFLAMTLILSFTLTAFAEDESNYLELDKNAEANVYLIKGTLEKNNPYRKLWVYFEYTAEGRKTKFTNSKYYGMVYSSKTQWLYNCDNKKMKVLASNFYNQNGGVAFSEDMGDAFDAVPGSIGAGAREVACWDYWNPEKI
jgi:hypothetical protein